jgi:hypothetical protein
MTKALRLLLRSSSAGFQLFSYAYFWQAREDAIAGDGYEWTGKTRKKRIAECDKLLRPVAHSEFWRAMREYRRQVEARERLGLPSDRVS